MKSHKGFDRLSRFYDLVVRLVFGQAIWQAQVALIREVNNKKHWLILGGGTGWILEDIFEAHPNARVTYVEASQKMIDQAKKRKLKGSVNYILGSLDQLPKGENYDVVMTAFFWDMFSTDESLKMKASIGQHLKNDVIWLLADFKNTDIWRQRVLLKVMYGFFRVTCRIEASVLPDFDKIFEKGKYEVLFCETFYHGMIQSAIYKEKDYS